ncbi:MAG TPA: AI-2E family transporter [Candidatus Binatia bacterium]|nr:AI-2E family transporter [Candidatus Binatia bacterium]
MHRSRHFQAPRPGSQRRHHRNQNLRDPGFTRRAFIATGLIIGAVIFLWALWFTRRVWLMCFAGVLLAVLLRRLADGVAKYTRLSSRWSLAVVYLCLLGILSFGGWLMAKPLSEQIDQLGERLPKAIEQVRSSVEQSSWGQALARQIRSGNDTSAGAQKALTHLTRVFSSTFEAVGSVLLVLFLGGYLAASPDLYTRGVTRLFPVRLRTKVRDRMSELGETLWHWIIGQLLAMTIVGTFIGIGLAVIGVPMPLALGLLAGLLEFIPFFGPLMAGTPAFLLAFTLSPTHALYVVALFIGVNFIENHFLIPLVHRRSVDLPPAVTLISLVAMGTLFGFLGMLLATPMAAVLLVLLRRDYVEGALEHRDSANDPHAAVPAG